MKRIAIFEVKKTSISSLNNLWGTSPPYRLDPMQQCLTEPVLRTQRYYCCLVTKFLTRLFITITLLKHVYEHTFFIVLINDTLTWSDHVGLGCRKVNGCLNLLRRLSWFLSRTLLLTYLYILLHIDYCDVIWSSCTQEESRRLHSLLNFGCKIVLRKRHDSSSTAALHELVTNDSQLEKKLHTAQCMFHCLSSKAPSYLTWLSLTLYPQKTSFLVAKTHVDNYER